MYERLKHLGFRFIWMAHDSGCFGFPAHHAAECRAVMEEISNETEWTIGKYTIKFPSDFEDTIYGVAD
jgi:hypothetical protein